MAKVEEARKALPPLFCVQLLTKFYLERRIFPTLWSLRFRTIRLLSLFYLKLLRVLCVPLLNLRRVPAELTTKETIADVKSDVLDRLDAFNLAYGSEIFHQEME